MDTETRRTSTETEPRATKPVHENEHECRAPSFRPGPFHHHRLDAFVVAREALVRGDRLSRSLPRGYGSLADQLRRSLLSAYLQVAEAANRSGRDRLARFRGARGEAGEAAAALEAVLLLELAPAAEVRAIATLCARLCAMLTRLTRPRR